MKPIDRYYFVLGDVIIRSLSWTIINTFKDKPIFSDGAIRKKLYECEADYSLGRISNEKFFIEATKISSMNMGPDEFESIIYNKVELIEGILEVIKELGKQYSLFLFSQYSPEFFDELSSRLNISDTFPDKNILYACRTGLPDLTDCLFEKIISEKWVIPGRSIWIDSDPHRTSASIRAGIDAIIFLDSKRLRREIALRGFLPLLGDE